MPSSAAAAADLLVPRCPSTFMSIFFVPSHIQQAIYQDAPATIDNPCRYNLQRWCFSPKTLTFMGTHDSLQTCLLPASLWLRKNFRFFMHTNTINIVHVYFCFQILCKGRTDTFKPEKHLWVLWKDLKTLNSMQINSMVLSMMTYDWLVFNSEVPTSCLYCF